MANFPAAIPLILLHEGEKYTNDQDDKGGPTKWGITMPDIPGSTAITIQQLTQEQASAIYLKKYWNPLRGDEIQSQAVADIFFDLGVARGLEGATDMMRSALGLKPRNNTWGRLDDETLSALNAACLGNHLQVAFDFLRVCDAARIARVEADPTQAKFLPGWLRRNRHDLAHVFCLVMAW